MSKILFKNYIANQLLNTTLFFDCDCLFPIKTRGKIIDYEIVNNEIVCLVDVGDKQIKIGENHPNLFVDKK